MQSIWSPVICGLAGVCIDMIYQLQRLRYHSEIFNCIDKIPNEDSPKMYRRLTFTNSIIKHENMKKTGHQSCKLSASAESMPMKLFPYFASYCAYNCLVNWAKQFDNYRQYSVYSIINSQGTRIFPFRPFRYKNSNVRSSPPRQMSSEFLNPMLIHFRQKSRTTFNSIAKTVKFIRSDKSNH